MNRSSITAFFLTFIPGMGHFYIDKKLRGFFYLSGCTLPLFAAFLFVFMNGYFDQAFILFMLFISIFTWFISLIDMVMILLRQQQRQSQQTDPSFDHVTGSAQPMEHDRMPAILLSFIPGLGHFYLGLINRGLTFLIGFFGLVTIIFFLIMITHEEGFFAFLGILPVLWILNMFDMIHLLNRKQRGEELVDRTILDDFEMARHEEGKKSKALATILSVFPGAGHMYLGLQKRGLQLMAAFLFAIYILDELRLSIFFFLIPLIWFYSFFDALQKVSRQGEEELRDIPIVSAFIHHQRWIGIGLILLGGYYLVDRILIPSLSTKIHEALGVNIANWYYNYFQLTVICVLLIGGGLKLIIGSKGRKE